MKHFILTHSWFVYEYILKYFGVYPLQRCGEFGLKVTKSFPFWMRYFLAWFLVSSLIGVTNYYIQNVVSTQDQVLGAMNKIMFTSLMSMVASVGALVLSGFLHLTTIISVRKMATYLIDLQEYCNEQLTIIQPTLIKNVKQTNMKLGLSLFVIFLSQASIIIGIWHQIFSLLDLDMAWLWFVIMTIQQILWIAFCFCPLFYFMFVYGEITSLMMAWCDELITLENISTITEEAYHLAKCIDIVGKSFSGPLFWIISNMLTALIVWVFNTINLFLNIHWSTTHWDELALIFGNLVACFYVTFVLFFLCENSEKLVCKVRHVNLKIMDFKMVNAEIETIYGLLDKFKGFNANGYFVVNSSLLTGMVANFVTYSVILIQFRQSESTIPECICNSTTVI